MRPLPAPIKWSTRTSAPIPPHHKRVDFECRALSPFSFLLVSFLLSLPSMSAIIIFLLCIELELCRGTTTSTTTTTTPRQRWTLSMLFERVTSANLFDIDGIAYRWWTPNRNFLINHLKCLVTIWMCRTHGKNKNRNWMQNIVRKRVLCMVRMLRHFNFCNTSFINGAQRREEKEKERKKHRREESNGINSPAVSCLAITYGTYVFNSRIFFYNSIWFASSILPCVKNSLFSIVFSPLKAAAAAAALRAILSRNLLHSMF